MNKQLLALELTRDEGVRLEAYKDSLGFWTIGVGHLIHDNGSPRVLRITENEANAWLLMDIEHAIGLARETFGEGFDYLSDARQRALTNMAFNLGSKLAGFRKFLAAAREGNWVTASIEMMDSKWATQVGARAERLRDMVLNG